MAGRYTPCPKITALAPFMMMAVFTLVYNLVGFCHISFAHHVCIGELSESNTTSIALHWKFGLLRLFSQGISQHISYIVIWVHKYNLPKRKCWNSDNSGKFRDTPTDSESIEWMYQSEMLKFRKFRRIPGGGVRCITDPYVSLPQVWLITIRWTRTIKN